MRIIAEWDEICPGGTAMQRRCEAFEGETVAEIDAAIRARAGRAEVMIVGLRNTRENFEICTGQTTRPEHRFADSPEQGRVARAFRRFCQWAGL